jgi:glycosyltransferase involved in cell wall biosynthesis
MESLKIWMPPGKNTRVIYNPMPENAVKWRGSGDAAKKHLLFVGRMSKKKGLLTLAESLRSVKNRNWSLDVLGDGPLAPQMKELVRASGLEDRIIFHGFSDDVAGFMSRCDLCLFPSLDEGLSLVLLNALASGTPVLASDITSNRELASRGGENPGGELLPPGDVNAWTDAIERFLDGKWSPSLKLAVKLPTPGEMTGQITDFYEETVREKIGSHVAEYPPLPR